MIPPSSTPFPVATSTHRTADANRTPTPLRSQALSAVLVALVVSLAQCAKVGRPTGGEVDRTAPAVTGHEPAADAARVPPEQAIQIEFSEPMDRKRTEAAVFIAPRSPVQFGWKGNTLTARTHEKLRDRQTYVVTVGSDARDLRGNSLDESYTFAFATGDELNRGRIHGSVFSQLRPAASAEVWAYDLDRFDGQLGRDRPQYQTQSARGGAYEFKRLSAGHFLIIAFQDGNRDGEHSDDEPLALPSSVVALAADTEVAAGDLNIVQPPPKPPGLTRAQALDEGRIILVFDQDVNVDSLEVAFDGLRIEAVHAAVSDPRKIYVATSPQRAGEEYAFSRLAAAGHEVQWEKPVRASTRVDRKAPALVAQSPTKTATLDDVVTLEFDEAMATAEPPGDDFWIASDSTAILAGVWTWVSPTLLSFRPHTPMTPGSYRLAAQIHQLSDRAGHAPADSTAAITFEVLVESDLSAISGVISGPADTTDHGTVQVVARSATDREYATRVDGAGAYAIGGMMPGSYTVMAFADGNDNGKPDPGSAHPFTPAESLALRPEAITLEPSRHSEGVDLILR